MLLKISGTVKRAKCYLFIAIAGIGLASGLLGGYTEAVFYSTVSAFFFAVYLDAKKWSRQLGFWSNLKNFKTTFSFAAIVAAGVLLASPWLVPTINFVSLTTRHGGVPETAGVPTDTLYLLLRYLYASFVPLLNISPLGISRFIFIGLLVYIFGFFGLLSFKKNRFAPYFIGLFVFTLLELFGPTHVFKLIHRLPVFSLFSGYWKWGFISNFSLSVLAGFGLDYLVEAKERINFKLFVRVLEGAAAFFLVFAITAAVFSAKFADYKFFISAVFIILSVLLFSFYQRGLLDFLRFKNLAVGVLLLNFVIGWQGVAFAVIQKEVFLSLPPTMEFLQKVTKKNEAFRIISPEAVWDYPKVLNSDGKEPVIYNLALGTDRLYMMYDGIFSVGGSEPFRSRRYDRVSQKLSTQNAVFLGMANVKYLVSPRSVEEPFTKVFETNVTSYNIPVYIYENPDVLPHVYFAKNVVYTAETDEDKLFEELSAISDFSKNTLIECGEPTCAASLKTMDGSDSKIVIKELKNAYLKLGVETKTPRWLVYSESNLPTWESRIDGQLTKIYTANYIYQAVFVPAGEHEIEFRYPGVWKQMKYAIINLLNLQ